MWPSFSGSGSRKVSFLMRHLFGSLDHVMNLLVLEWEHVNELRWKILIWNERLLQCWRDPKILRTSEHSSHK